MKKKPSVQTAPRPLNPSRKGRGNEMRERILDAAFGTFLTHGYTGTSTLAIATAAQVSKRELYAHFKNKEALFAAGIKGRTDLMRVPLKSPDLSNATMLAKTLVAYGISLLTEVTHPHVLAVHRLAIGESMRSPELPKILDREGRQTNVGALTELMRQAQQRGLLGTGAPEDLAQEFSSLLWGDLLLRLLLRVIERPTGREIEHRARRATEAFFELHGEQSAGSKTRA